MLFFYTTPAGYFQLVRWNEAAGEADEDRGGGGGGGGGGKEEGGGGGGTAASSSPLHSLLHESV